MKNMRWTKLVIAGCGLALVVGCSGLRGGSAGMAGANGGPGGGDDAATTAGVDARSDFGSSGSATALKAPHNQTYYFGFDRDRIGQQDVASIEAQANYLVGHQSARIRLEGNTDERGSREYNIALGWRRARAVASVLRQEGVSKKQIQMVSYGEEKPMSFGHTESAYQRNRRVNLVYTAY